MTQQAATKTDPQSGAQFLGGEMLEWSDLADARRPSGVLPLVTDLVESVRPTRTLLLGPLAASLVEALPENAAVDIVTRALFDIQAVSGVTGTRPKARLYCGGVDHFTPDRPYDLVISLGGPTTLLGPDSAGMSEAAYVELVAGWVEEGGVVLLASENPLGLHELVGGEPENPVTSNNRWWVGAPGFDHRPPHLPELRAAVDAVGLTRLTELSAYPSPAQPMVLADLAEADGPAGPLMRLTLTRAVETYFRDHPALYDARSRLVEVLDAGLGAALAPAWYVVASRGERPAPALGAVYAAESAYAARWCHQVVVSATGEARVSWAEPSTDTEVQERTLSRHLTPAASVPGETLDALLRQACAERDHHALRTLVRQYRTFLDRKDHTAGTLAFATPDNVVVSADGPRLLDSSWRLAVGLDPRLAFLRGLRRFALGLLLSGGAHPWRPLMTPDGVAHTLAAMAGVNVRSDDLRSIASLEVTLDTLSGAAKGEQEDLLDENLEMGSTEVHLPSATAAGYRQLLAHDRSLSQAVRAQESQIAWLEGTMRLRDRRIREYDRLMDKLEKSISYRTIWTLEAPRRAVVRKAKDTVDEQLPPDLRSRISRLLRRGEPTRNAD